MGCQSKQCIDIAREIVCVITTHLQKCARDLAGLFFTHGDIMRVMIWATAVWLGVISLAYSGDCRDMASIPGAQSIKVGGDIIVIAPHDTARAQLCYENVAEQASNGERWRVWFDGFSVAGSIKVGVAETITIEPPVGYVVRPAPVADVEDGDTFSAIIFSALM